MVFNQSDVYLIKKNVTLSRDYLDVYAESNLIDEETSKSRWWSWSRTAEFDLEFAVTQVKVIAVVVIIISGVIFIIAIFRYRLVQQIKENWTLNRSIFVSLFLSIFRWSMKKKSQGRLIRRNTWHEWRVLPVSSNHPDCVEKGVSVSVIAFISAFCLKQAKRKSHDVSFSWESLARSMMAPERRKIFYWGELCKCHWRKSIHWKMICEVPIKQALFSFKDRLD